MDFLIKKIIRKKQYKFEGGAYEVMGHPLLCAAATAAATEACALPHSMTVSVTVSLEGRLVEETTTR